MQRSFDLNACARRRLRENMQTLRRLTIDLPTAARSRWNRCKLSLERPNGASTGNYVRARIVLQCKRLRSAASWTLFKTSNGKIANRSVKPSFAAGICCEYSGQSRVNNPTRECSGIVRGFTRGVFSRLYTMFSQHQFVVQVRRL